METKVHNVQKVMLSLSLEETSHLKVICDFYYCLSSSIESVHGPVKEQRIAELANELYDSLDEVLNA